MSSQASFNEKEKRLLSAVIQLLNEVSDISQLKISDIAARAGIGKGTVYEHFKSKEELITSAVSFHIHSIAERFSLIIQNSGDFRSTIEKILCFVDEVIVSNQKLAYAFLNIVKSSQENACALPEGSSSCSTEQLRKAVFSLIEKGRSEGVVLCGDEKAYYLFILIMSGYSHYQIPFIRSNPKASMCLPGTEKEKLHEYTVHALLSALG